MSWADTTSAIADLRTLLSDGPTDKVVYQKKVFGTIDGLNRTFRTFDSRRVTDFSKSATVAPFGVYIDNVLQAYTLITTDVTDSGDFIFASAPTAGNHAMTASYYYQWFLDSELDQFLKNAGNWIANTDVYTSVVTGLIPAALEYAAGKAFHKLSVKASIRASSVFLVEDAPKKEAMEAAKSFAEIAKTYSDAAFKFRNDFYTRQGQALQPLFNNATGAIRDITPRR